jgi:small subunit ribosomal protein S17
MPKRVLSGTVVSDKGDKTVVVRVERRVKHPLYGKIIRLSKKYHAHDQDNSYRAGEQVRIEECAPISKLKSWSVLDRIGAAKAVEVEIVEGPTVAAEKAAEKSMAAAAKAKAVAPVEKAQPVEEASAASEVTETAALAEEAAPVEAAPVEAKEAKPAKKAPAKKSPIKAVPAKNVPAKKGPAKKAPAKKAPAKKAPAKKAKP